VRGCELAHRARNGQAWPAYYEPDDDWG
jgi:hypothetical protein